MSQRWCDVLLGVPSITYDAAIALDGAHRFLSGIDVSVPSIYVRLDDGTAIFRKPCSPKSWVSIRVSPKIPPCVTKPKHCGCEGDAEPKSITVHGAP